MCGAPFRDAAASRHPLPQTSGSAKKRTLHELTCITEVLFSQPSRSTAAGQAPPATDQRVCEVMQVVDEGVVALPAGVARLHVRQECISATDQRVREIMHVVDEGVALPAGGLGRRRVVHQKAGRLPGPAALEHARVARAARLA